MKFKMSERSLFAILLRAPWWVSFVVMAGVMLVAGALLPQAYKAVGILGGFPFLVIGFMAAWRQRHRLSAQRTEALLAQAAGMAWKDFAAIMVGALQRQGFAVVALSHGPADFRIEKQGRVTLVSAKRWKAANVGAEHLRELLAEGERQQAFSCSCMSLGRVSQAAQELADQSPLQLLGPAQIAELMAG